MKAVDVLTIILLGVVIVGNVPMLFLFASTTVGLTAQQSQMLVMTSVQVNQMYAQSMAILAQLQATGNYTDKVLLLTQQLADLQSRHDTNNITTAALEASAAAQKTQVLAFNATIETTFITLVQPAIDNVTLPASFNQTLDATVEKLDNGTALWFNPNDASENVTLTFDVNRQLGITYLSFLPVNATLNFTVGGSYNWTTVTATNFFHNSTYLNGTVGQVLDDQRLTIPVDGRDYYPAAEEIRLPFDGAAPTPFSIGERGWEMNVGLF
jgi:hypothetical protein